MKSHKLGCVLLIAAMAMPQAASAAGADLMSATGRQLASGVSTEVAAGGFSLVTLGVWQASSGVNRLISDPLRRGRIPAAGMTKIGSASFRRAIYLPHVQAAERRFGLPQGLLDALIWTESRYDPVAFSKAGAAGLGQLMPATARALGVTNRYEFHANLLGSAQYLRQMLDKFGEVHLAIAAYNAGPGAVQAAAGIPQNRETISYVRNIISHWVSISQK